MTFRKNNTILGIYYFHLFYIFFLFGCSNNSNVSNEQTATSGYLNVHSDATFKYLVDAEIDVFQNIYTKASLNPIYTSENSAIHKLLYDSTRLAITGRSFDSNEVRILKKQDYSSKSILIAHDAIAMLCSRKMNDSIFSLTELKKILEGKASQQIMLNKENITLLNSLLKKLSIDINNAKILAVNGNDSLFNYIDKHENSIGIISMSTLNIEENLENLKLQNIKLLAISNDKNETSNATPSDVMLKKYPFILDVHLNLKGRAVGVGSGFASFCASERGQMIVLKCGLVPAIMPGREVQISNKF